MNTSKQISAATFGYAIVLLVVCVLVYSEHNLDYAYAADPSPEGTAQPTATPAGILPQIQSLSIQQVAPTDRGIDSNTLNVNLFDTSELKDPIQTLRWTDPISFHFECFGESYPYEGCELVEDLEDGANWGVRWEGELLVPSGGEYKFSLPGHDDGVRIFIGGAEIIDRGWRYPDPDIRPSPQTVSLEAGTHEIVIDYQQRVPFIAELEVRWDGPTFSEEILPVTAVEQPFIQAVELTQSIQEYQDIDVFMAELEQGGTPPVPIMANRPIALRVYFSPVPANTEVVVELTGAINESKTTLLLPACTAKEAREQDLGCFSTNFGFEAPEGEWSIELVTHDSEGNQIENHEFTILSEEVGQLNLLPIRVCDAIEPESEEWLCGTSFQVSDLLPFFRNSFPIDVDLDSKTVEVRRETSTAGSPWMNDVLGDILDLWTEAGSPSDEYYHGMVRSSAGGTEDDPGGLAYLPSTGQVSVSRASVMRTNLEGESVETADEVLAHELGHTFGRKHAPSPSDEGCYGTPSDIDGNWLYDTSPFIQEVGFNLDNGRALPAEEYTDWMTYCTPRWITPYTYRESFAVFSNSSSSATGMTPSETSPSWLVSGIVNEASAVVRPLFTLPNPASSDPGLGDYRIEIRDEFDNVLFTRRFEPISLGAHEGINTPTEGPPAFSELIPVMPGADSIAVIHPEGEELGLVKLDGEKPSVEVTSPVGGELIEGLRELSWSVTDTDSDQHTYWLQYSRDDGRTWETLFPRMTASETMLDGSQLTSSEPISRIRIFASDGVNTGVTVTDGFTVPGKNPIAKITSPGNDSVYASAQLVLLRGHATDPDDGSLDERDMIWRSSVDGNLGTGDELLVTHLSEGTHQISFSVSDSDGNSATDSISIQVDGTAPQVDMDVVRDAIPSSCVDITLDASDDVLGSGIASLDYSLDGGGTWVRLAPDDLPIDFIVPSSGPIHLVSLVTDAAGNIASEDVMFTIESPCPSINRPPSADAGGPYSSDEGQTVTLDASGSTDPDDNIISYEWDLDSDGQYDDATGVTAEVIFGDNGSFVVGVRVTDEFGESDTDDEEVVVNNLPPEIELDASDAISAEAGDTFLGRMGEPQIHQATVTDPGSDDLTFNWSFGSTLTYFNDGVGPDPFPSPDGVFPFTAEDTAKALFEEAALTEVSVEISDDDGATVSSGLPKIVTGDSECIRSQGFWRHQFRDIGRQHVGESTLLAYIEIVNFVSGYFSEVVPLMDFEEAQEVFDVSGPGLRSRSEAQVAAAWFNFAHGSVAWDELIETGDDELELAPFHDVIAAAEAIILDPNATNDDLERAKNLAETINELEHEGDECEDDFEHDEGPEDEGDRGGRSGRRR